MRLPARADAFGRSNARTADIDVRCAAHTVFLAPILAIVLALSACDRPTVKLELITPNLPTDRAIARDIVSFVSEDSGIEIELIPAPVGQSTLDALESGYGDIAFTSNDQPFRSGVVTIMPLYPTVLHIVARVEIIDDDFRKMLVGSRIFAGSVGSASRNLTERLLTDLKIGAEEVSYIESRDDGPPDIIIVFAAINPNGIPELPGYQALSFGRPEDIGKGSNVDRATLLNPRLRPFIIPIGTYGDRTPEAVVTVAVDELLVARDDMPPPVAYDLIREIMRMRPALSGNRPAIFHRLNDDIDPSSFTFAMHPGARFFVDRDEPTWIERYSGVAEVAVTLLIALVSGSFAAANIYRIRRKNRIDVFYSEVFELRKAIDEPLDQAGRDKVIDKLRALQQRAFDMLVDEKLAADESFRIFITLSNDAIRDLGGRQPARFDD